MLGLQKLFPSLNDEQVKVADELAHRGFLINGSNNKVVMQAHGLTYILSKQIDKIWADDEEGRKAAYVRHSAYFNTQPTMGCMIWPIIYVLEQNYHDGLCTEDAIINMKVALMGPVAGIGDTLYQGSLTMICAGIAIGFANQGSILGPLLYILLFGSVTFFTKFIWSYIGMAMGTGFIDKLLQGGYIETLTRSVSVLGLMMIGNIAATAVKFKFNWVIKIGELSTDIQKELFDAVLPGIVPLGLVFICFGLLRKRVSPTKIIYGMMIAGILFAFLKML